MEDKIEKLEQEIKHLRQIVLSLTESSNNDKAVIKALMLRLEQFERAAIERILNESDVKGN